jgi:ubiquinone/menaquinone biosynthesis C-methylase UbiE
VEEQGDTATKSAVRQFWDERPCAESLADAPRGTDAYYSDIESAKEQLEPFVHRYAEFERWSGRDVLEIGCGVGTDSVRFARAGAVLTSVDLTDTAVELTRGWLASESLPGTVLQADAEQLPFADGSFDLVYSWGVLHHTPDTPRALAEVRRVLRPGAEARIMLYNRHSLFAAGVWLRHGLVRSRPVSLTSVLATNLESPGTQAFTRRELETLFAGFASVEIETITTPYDRRVAGPPAGLFPRAGWFHVIRART